MKYYSNNAILIEYLIRRGIAEGMIHYCIENGLSMKAGILIMRCSLGTWGYGEVCRAARQKEAVP